MIDSSTPTLENRTERLLTVREVAEWLNVAEGTLRYWRHTHRGPRSLTLQGGVRYRAGDIEEWLERGAKRGER
jgi:predicted DNA-binding transcriptional regulator AlpA